MLNENVNSSEFGRYEPTITTREAYKRIINLEKENDAKSKCIEMLEECLLEMSEIVYAGD